ncbi:uncharacterized protein LOC129598404 [Paramacrobiotus metropolitanus]|uniref:uncharacterized protein LOC129598404 n=1 Tax=Paramacrobiotus metropolitanus TaxID=2943436 RepID=UPI002445AB99|nr:uncharacterized protein LOC129598404 [Paramacrobiotus metropolitanus]
MPIDYHRINSVHVQGDDGLYRLGRVVDVADDGLFVDMLRRNQRREFVPFGWVFFPCMPAKRSVLAEIHAKEIDHQPMQALVRETNSGPWVWQDAEIISVPYQSVEAAVVQWEDKNSGVLSTDIVPIKRLRYADDDLEGCFFREGDNIEPGIFARCSVQLDERFRSLTTEAATALIAAATVADNSCGPELFMRMVELVDGRLGVVYLRLRFKSCDADDLRFQTALANLQANLPRCLELSEKHWERVDSCALLPELWMEVLSHLDAVNQAQLRAISSTWNRLLTAPPLTATLVLTRSKDDRRFAFLTAAVIYKGLGATTRHLVVAPEDKYDLDSDDLLAVAGMIHFVAERQPGIRLRGLYLHGVTLDVMINGVRDNAEFEECVAHQPPAEYDRQGRFCRLQELVEVVGPLPCEVLRMFDCTTELACVVSERRKDFLSASLSGAWKLSLGAGFGCALWNALEAPLATPSTADHKFLKQFLAKQSVQNPARNDAKITVCKMLCALQSADPRPTSHYRGKQWCVDGMQGIQLEKLSRMTKAFLCARFKKSSHAATKETGRTS